MAPVRDIMQSLPPLLSTIHEQTGISPPSWIAQMPPNKDNREAMINKHSALNGAKAN